MVPGASPACQLQSFPSRRVPSHLIPSGAPWLLPNPAARGAQGRAPRAPRPAPGTPSPGSLLGAPLGGSPAVAPGGLRERVGAPFPLPQDPHPPKSGDKMLPGLRRLLQGKGPPFSGARGCGVRGTGWEAKPRPGPHPRAPRFAPRCLELVTVGGRARLSGRAGLGFRGRCGAGLHLLRGTRRTLAGWGSADSASRGACPAPGASALCCHPGRWGE